MSSFTKAFAIFCDQKLLVVLTDLKSPLPLPTTVLDWYAREYGYERERLSWASPCTIDCKDMKYEDFK
jgi:hypothetical protein